MGFDFPNTPSEDQIFNAPGGPRYIFKSPAWKLDKSGSGSSSVETGDTPPASPKDGALWWESDTGKLFVWYEDGDSGQWVEASPGGGSGELILPERFGAVGNGAADDKIALEAAFSASATGGGMVLLRPGSVYAISSLVIAAGASAFGTGSFRHTGATSSGDIVSIGADCRIENLIYSTPAHANTANDIRIGAGSQIGYVETVADSQSQGNEADLAKGVAVITAGQDVKIGFHKCVNIDRPLHIDNTAGGSLTTGFQLGGYDYVSYACGIRANGVKDGSIGPGTMRVRSPNSVNQTIGHNSIVIYNAQNFMFGDAVLEDAGEHCVRFGGATHASGASTVDVAFGNLVIKRPSASAIKVNPGTGRRVKRVSFGGVTVVDCGFITGTTIKAADGLRLSHCDDISVGSLRLLIEALATSGDAAVKLNACTNIHIGLVDARFPLSSLFVIDETADVTDPLTEAGPVSNVYVDKLVGVRASGSAYAFSFVMPHYDMGNLYFRNLDVSDLTSGLLAYGAVTNLVGDVLFHGKIAGSATAGNISSLPANDFTRYDLSVNNTRHLGPARQSNASSVNATMVVSGAPLDIAAAPTSIGALDIMTVTGTGALGSLGAPIVWQGPGFSSRRRVAIAPKQTGASTHNVGLAFFTNAGASGNEQLMEVLQLKHGGGVKVPLVTYADNAAAIAGGLVANEFYKTATGELRIVV